MRNLESVSQRRRQPDQSARRATLQQPERLLVHIEIPGFDAMSQQDRVAIQRAAEQRLDLWRSPDGTYEGLPISVQVVEAP